MFARVTLAVALSLFVFSPLCHAETKQPEKPVIEAPALGPMDQSPDEKTKAKKMQIPSTRNDFEKIIARSKARLKKNPQDALAYVDLGYAYGNLLQPARDLECCNKAIAIDPNIPVAYSERAKAYMMLRMEAKALKDLEKAISLDPNNSAFYKTRGWIYGRQGKYKEAIAECTKSISIYDGFSPAFYCRGRAHLFLEDYKKAIADYTQAIRLFPNEVEDYYSERAFAYNSLGQYQKALADLNTALKINPRDVPSLIYRSICLANLGDERAAVSNLNEAIRIQPELANAYAQRGRAYLALKEFDKSLQDLNKAIELDKEEQQAYQYRGKWHLERENYKQAISDLKMAISLNSSEKGCYATLALAYMGVEDYQNAIKWWDKVLETAPSDGEAISSRALARQKLKLSATNSGAKEKAGSGDSPDSTPSSLKKGSVRLTSRELNLAKVLGYSSQALALVKQATGAELSKLTMNCYGPWSPKFERKSDFEYWTPKSIALVKAMANKYPELAPALEIQIKKLESPPITQSSSLGDKKKIAEDIDYKIRLFTEFGPYFDYLRSEAGADKFDIALVGQKKSPKEAYLFFKEKFANVKLPKEYLPVQAIGLYLPSNFGAERILELQDKLKPLGYSFFGGESAFVSQSFDTKSEAEKFAGKDMSVLKRPVHYRECTFDPAKFDPKDNSTAMWLFPGVEVKKVSPTKWILSNPESYRVDGTRIRAVLVKGIDQYRYLEFAKSRGPNYRITNRMVIKKLKEWDESYGLRVVSADGDSVRFHLTQEPRDLGKFFQEVYLFCPDVIQ